MSFFTQIFLVLTWSSEGPPSSPLGDFVQVSIPEELTFPQRKICPRKSLYSLEVEVIEFTIKDVREFQGKIHHKTYPVILITPSLIFLNFDFFIVDSGTNIDDYTSSIPRCNTFNGTGQGFVITTSILSNRSWFSLDSFKGRFYCK
jgi:hypothetical protein